MTTNDAPAWITPVNKAEVLDVVARMLNDASEATARDAKARIAAGQTLPDDLRDLLIEVENYAAYELPNGEGTVMQVPGITVKAAELAGWIELTTDPDENRVWVLTSTGRDALDASEDADRPRPDARQVERAAYARGVRAGLAAALLVMAIVALVGTAFIEVLSG
jgi:hypothetical protein